MAELTSGRDLVHVNFYGFFISFENCYGYGIGIKIYRIVL